MSTGCMVNLNAATWTPGSRRPAELCQEPAAYEARVAGCCICRQLGRPECGGHPVCVGHGAELRAGALRDAGRTAALVRICGTGREAAA